MCAADHDRQLIHPSSRCCLWIKPMLLNNQHHSILWIWSNWFSGKSKGCWFICYDHSVLNFLFSRNANDQLTLPVGLVLVFWKNECRLQTDTCKMGENKNKNLNKMECLKGCPLWKFPTPCTFLYLSGLRWTLPPSFNWIGEFREAGICCFHIW